jgi:hypothetical protein
VAQSGGECKVNRRRYWILGFWYPVRS